MSYRVGKLSLDKENYGLPIGERIPVQTVSRSYHVGRRTTKVDCMYTFQMIKDNDRLAIRRGDVFKFGMRFRSLKGTLGVVLDRYRIIKDKGWGTFKAYCAVVLIISGSRKGEVYNVCDQRVAGLIKNVY